MADEADSGAVALIQRFGPPANLNIRLHCLVLDGVYRRSEAGPHIVEVTMPTEDQLQTVLHKIITHTMKLLARRGVLIEEEGSIYLPDGDAGSDEARTLEAAAGSGVYLSHCVWPASGSEGTDGARRDAARRRHRASAARRHAGVSAYMRPCAAALSLDARQPLRAAERLAKGANSANARPARPMSARRWSNFAATSPARRWPTNECSAKPPGKSC